MFTLYHTVQPFNDPKKEGFGKHCVKRRKCWIFLFNHTVRPLTTLRTKVLENIVWKGENANFYNSTTQCSLSTTLRKKALENIVWKGENAGDQHFLLFPQCFFFTRSQRDIIILASFYWTSANAFNLVKSKILSFGTGFNFDQPFIWYDNFSLFQFRTK